MNHEEPTPVIRSFFLPSGEENEMCLFRKMPYDFELPTHFSSDNDMILFRKV